MSQQHADITPEDVAALYLWAIGDGRREPPTDSDAAKHIGRGLAFLVERAGDWLAWEPIDLDEDESGEALATVCRVGARRDLGS